MDPTSHNVAPQIQPNPASPRTQECMKMFPCVFSLVLHEIFVYVFEQIDATSLWSHVPSRRRPFSRRRKNKDGRYGSCVYINRDMTAIWVSGRKAQNSHGFAEHRFSYVMCLRREKHLCICVFTCSQRFSTCYAPRKRLA